MKIGRQGTRGEAGNTHGGQTRRGGVGQCWGQGNTESEGSERQVRDAKQEGKQGQASVWKFRKEGRKGEIVK